MTEHEYKEVCRELEYQQQKHNEQLRITRIKEAGRTTVINALTEMKDKYEMGQ